MLAELRKSAGSWVVRILLGLLILSFGIWGIGDFIRGDGGRDLAKVGSVTISTQEFDEQYRRDLQVWQQRLGIAVDNERARQLGLAENTLQTMVQRALVDQAASDLKLGVSEATLAREIRDNPLFHNATGQFDRLIFERVLFNNGFSEQGYIQRFRQDFLRDILLSSIEGSVTRAPAPLVDTLFAYRQERRVADILLVPPLPAASIPEPDDATLEKFHQDNAPRFTAPEYRALTFVVISPDALREEVGVSEEELQEEYDSRRESFEVPERREVQQIVYSDQAAAAEALARIRGGEDFAAVAKATRNLEASDIALGRLTRRELPSAVAEVAFALAGGAISEPVQSPLGWHLIRVGAIEPGQRRTLAEVREELTREVALRKAADLVFRTANQIQDEIAGGGGLEAAAEKMRLKVMKIPAVDQRGLARDGLPAPGLPDLPNFLEQAFLAPQGGEPQLVETSNDAYFLLRVDDIVPSTLKPFAEIRAEVLSAWRTVTADEKALEKAREIADRLKEGGNFPALARAQGGEIRSTGAFTRGGQGAEAGVPARIVPLLFQAKRGEAVAAPAGPGAGAVVAQLTEIRPADGTAEADARKRLADALQGAIANDIGTQYRAALESEFGVRIYRQVFETLLN
ncbi:MAG: SurA N-terminal domain-containing protein [Alphaproteobacteria bacterium]|nr:SurA N-terminal domain-containing protein [Alphaproteobacteria bacterium]